MMVRFLKKHNILLSIFLSLMVIFGFDVLDLAQYAKAMNWIAFGIGLFAVIFLEISKKSALRSKILRAIGFSLLFCIILFMELRLRYEYQTSFGQPCWSPDGKQIAFFMNKRLDIFGWSPIGGWSVNDEIWKKHYLCTMDYDGGNFKAVKQTESGHSVIWPSAENIVYNQKIMIDKLHYKKYEGKTYKIYPDGTGLEELWQWNEKSEYQNAVWLTPDAKYLIMLKVTDTGRTYSIYDRREKKIKKTFTLYGEFFGSYKNNQIAFRYNNVLTIVDLDSLEVSEKRKKEPETFDKQLDGFTYSIASSIYSPDGYSPDRSMYTRPGGVWTVGDNKVVSDFYVKPKRSYLFNIFGE